MMQVSHVLFCKLVRRHVGIRQSGANIGDVSASTFYILIAKKAIINNVLAHTTRPAFVIKAAFSDKMRIERRGILD